MGYFTTIWYVLTKKSYSALYIVWWIYSFVLFTCMGFIPFTVKNDDMTFWQITHMCFTRNTPGHFAVLFGFGMMLAAPALLFGWIAQAIQISMTTYGKSIVSEAEAQNEIHQPRGE